jgi:hypothetical protein
MKHILLLAFLALALRAYPQSDSSGIRTRSIDYTEYDQLMTSLGYAQDKLGVSRKLLAEADKLFTAVDEEYFLVRNMVFYYYEQAYDFRTAIQCLVQAIDAYERHYPFYNRGYVTVTPDYALQCYASLGSLYVRIGLYDKAMALLRPLETLMETASGSARQMYHSTYSQALAKAGYYDEALREAFRLRDLTESGALDINMPPADEIYKIDESWPEETKRQMQEGKKQYEKTRTESMTSLRATQRMNYNWVISEAYFNQYRFEESIPYAEAWITDNRASTGASARLMEASRASMASYPDSLRKTADDYLAYLELMNEIGSFQAVMLAIAAGKTGRTAEAVPYVTGLFDKAVLNQVSGNLDQAESLYAHLFARLDQMSRVGTFGGTASIYRKHMEPYRTNLRVLRAEYAAAHREAQVSLEAEEATLRRNFHYFSEAEKKEFFRAYTRQLEKYYSLLLLMTENGQDKSEELLNKVLQTKGLILDVTREQERTLKRVKDPATIAQVKEIRHMREKLAAFYSALQGSPGGGLTDSISRYSRRLTELEQSVNAKVGASSDLLKPVSWKQVQAKLKPGEVYVEVLRLPRDNFSFDKPNIQYWLFAVKPGMARPVLFKLREGEALDTRGLKYYQNMIRTQQEDKFSFGMFWAQLSETLQGATTVVLSPDGAYHMINPLTLKSPKSGNYLLSEIELKRVATGRDLLADAPAVKTKSITLVGNPEFGMSRAVAENRSVSADAGGLTESTPEGTRAGFADLPGTGLEVDVIQELAAAAGFTATELTGSQASEPNLKKIRDPGVLHIATHGEFDQRSRADSYLRAKLILAGAADPMPLSIGDYSRYEDGLLTAYEVLQLELAQTRLVVLSACETGLGEVQSGEGVWGLQRAFQLAGAGAVMGSLWKISDEATVVIMEEFYRRYFAGEGFGTCYRGAMEAARKLNDHPYYWGAFVLSGREE